MHGWMFQTGTQRVWHGPAQFAVTCSELLVQLDHGGVVLMVTWTLLLELPLINRNSTNRQARSLAKALQQES